MSTDDTDDRDTGDEEAWEDEDDDVGADEVDDTDEIDGADEADETDRTVEATDSAREADAAERTGAATDRDRRFEPGPRSLARNRTVVTAGGAVIAVLGVLAIASPFVTDVAPSLVFGGLLVVGALVQVAAAFSAQRWRGAVFEVLLALLYAGGGIALLANPTLELVALTLLLAVFFLSEGVVQMLMGLRVKRNSNSGWLLFSGAVSLVFATLVLLELPSRASWGLGLVFGVALVTSGLALLLLGLGAESAGETTAFERFGESRTES